MMAGVGLLLESFTSLILPHSKSTVGDVAGILELAELPIIARLVVWGAKAQASKKNTVLSRKRR